MVERHQLSPRPYATFTVTERATLWGRTGFDGVLRGQDTQVGDRLKAQTKSNDDNHTVESVTFAPALTTAIRRFVLPKKARLLAMAPARALAA